MGFFDDFSNTADTILGIGSKAADIYDRFAGTGGSNNAGALPVTYPIPVAAPDTGMSTTTMIVLGVGAAVILFLMLRKRG